MQQPYKDELLFSFFYTFFKKKWLILWTFVVIFFGSVVMVGVMTPRFEGTAQVMMDLNPRYQVIVFPELQTPSGRLPAVDPAQNLVGMLTNRKMAREVVEAFELNALLKERRTESSEFREVVKRSLGGTVRGIQNILGGLGLGKGAPARTDDWWFEAAVDEFMDDWNRIEIEKETSIINVTVLAPEPELARRIASWMVDRLNALVAEQTRNKFVKMRGFVRENMQDAEERLATASEALKTQLGQEDPAALEKERDLLIGRQTALYSELADATANREGARKRLAELQKQLEDQDIRTLTKEVVEYRQPSVTMLSNDLQNLQAQMAALSLQLTEEHPARKELQARIEKTRELIETTVKEDFHSRIRSEESNPLFIQSITQIADAVAEETIAEALITALDAQKNEIAGRIKSLASELAAADNARQSLEREMEAAESYFVSLKERSMEIEALANNPEGEFDLRLIDPAHNPDGDESSLPNWGLVFPVAFIVAGLFALMIAFFLEYWRNAYRNSWEFEAETGAEIILTVPRIRKSQT